MIKNLGTSVANPGQVVKAVKTIKKKLEQQHTADPFNSIFQYAVRFGFERLELIKSTADMKETGRLAGVADKRKQYDNDTRKDVKRGRGSQRGRFHQNRFHGDSSDRPCYICNGGIHREVDCWLYAHPDGNHENKPFEHSTKGAEWAAQNYQRLPNNIKLDGSSWTIPNQPQ
jgi:hypothetical protein